MSSIIASYPRARRNDLPEYVRKFRLESGELHSFDQQQHARLPASSPALIWVKVASMSVASTALLYVMVLLTQ